MRKLSILLFLLLSLSSCRMVSSLIHDDKIVARVGNNKLYAEEVRQYLPAYVSVSDSLNLSLQYINRWAAELLYLDMAETQLSKEELDVTAELEGYRRSLLKYRYEQRYVSDRLDTLVTDAQIEDYYQSHEKNFELVRPVVRFRFIDIPRNCPNRDLLLKKLCSRDYDDALDSLAARSALRYLDSSEEWNDVLMLAREFNAEWKALLAGMSGAVISVTDREFGGEKVAFVCEMVQSGTAPMDYCREEIKNIILSTRKHDLLQTLERDLLEDAMEHQKFVIYQ